jgi:hypothetical protein
MNFPPKVGEFPAVIKANRARTHNRDPEFRQNVTDAHSETEGSAEILCSLAKRPLLSLEAAGDQPRPFVKGEIGPGPLKKDRDPVAETNQVKNVHEQPRQPGR